MIIKNSDDLRAAYTLLLVLQEFLSTCKKPDKVKLHIIELKRCIRDYGHSKVSGREIVMDNGIDGYVQKIQLPQFVESKEEAEEYMEENEKITMRLTPWDCTGQAFTNWYKVFNTNGSWRAYHSIGFDV